MAWSSPLTVIAGQLMTPAFWNAQVKDQLTELRAGGVALPSLAVNDLVVATSATQLACVAKAPSGVPFYSGGAWAVRNLMDLTYPVGTLYYSVVSTNPATLFGAGTWVAFGQGRMVVGVDVGNALFDSTEKIGGSATIALTTAELPIHAHGINDAGHAHLRGFENRGGGDEFQVEEVSTLALSDGNKITSSSVTGITLQNAGSSGQHNNVQPSIVVYMWKRTA